VALLEPTRTELDIESLLPVVYRLHDEARKRPLASLLEVIGEQAGLVKGNIDDLWDDFFIETCADWVIPYIGDLVGNNLLPGRVRRPRADVAKTIYYRRRKGTLPMLEELARDVTLWRAHTVPFFELANWTQNLNHLRFHPQPEPRPPRPRGLVGTVSVRDPETADLVDGPFDVTAHSVDIRPVARREGWPSLRRLGFFFWRLGGYPLTGVTPRQGPQPHLFHFNPLGLDTQLFTSAAREAAETELAEEVHVPAPIRRLAFHRQLGDLYGHVSTGVDATRSRSVAVYRGTATGDGTLVPAAKVVARNLAKWEDLASQPPVGKVAIDVRLGRLAFNEADVPPDLRVSYTYGFSADIGGGPYAREIDTRPGLWTRTVRQTGSADFDSVSKAVLAWEAAGRPSGTITVLDSATYDEPLTVSVTDRGALTIQAHDGARPHLLLPAGLAVTYGGPAGAENRDAALTLSGLLVEGQLLVGPRCLRALRITHTTLVPGESESIVVTGPNDALQVAVDSSILGAIRMPAAARGLTVTDGIVDSAGAEAGAIGPTTGGGAFGPTTTLERVTVLGGVKVRELRLASETIFAGTVTSQRRQSGCVRFSYVPPGSQTPRRYRCQPDLALENDPPKRELDRILRRLRPAFTSIHHAEPAYGQLASTCPRQIRTGAADGGEMGAFNQLEQPQREANLRLRLDEYMPFGLEPGVIYVT
jgi:hypothetical protein